MEFTLRQARNLESRLRNLAIDNQIIEIRSYDSEVARQDIEAGVERLDYEIETKIALNEIRHTIKNLINQVNMDCGVSSLLNKRDELYAKRDILNTLGSSDTVERQLEHISNSAMKPARIVCVYTEEIEDGVDRDLADIDHNLNEISRELNELNNSRVITLCDEDVEELKAFGVL